MTQDGMPLKFELVEIETGKVVNIFTEESFDPDPVYLDEKRFAWRQAIGATSSDDPKQALYVGDLIGFNLDKKDVVGLIVWKGFQVWVKIQKHENWVTYLSMSHVLDFFAIKKLGSSRDPQLQGVLEKAGLER